MGHVHFVICKGFAPSVPTAEEYPADEFVPRGIGRCKRHFFAKSPYICAKNRRFTGQFVMLAFVFIYIVGSIFIFNISSGELSPRSDF